MVRAWLMCSPVINQSAPCSRDPSVDLSTDKLHQLGILTQYVSYAIPKAINLFVMSCIGFSRKICMQLIRVPVVDKNGLLDKICKERGYTVRDKLVVSRDVTPDYDTEIKKLFEEHMHIDEEARYIVDGSGYFDVRNENDAWVRIAVEPGDVMILPSGIFHRFTPDHRDYFHALRLFKENHDRIPHNRTELAKLINAREGYIKEYVEKHRA
ncbi:unnamed protein product [Anisakis simplex]|uniref:Acireductone dioxygenase n=1 Tax=Anisakis simplex TaxID=6269 RepID=A0A0M3K491_ANISI|nr:unnamed protein product [Anisakis simplex]